MACNSWLPPLWADSEQDIQPPQLPINQQLTVDWVYPLLHLVQGNFGNGVYVDEYDQVTMESKDSPDRLNQVSANIEPDLSGFTL